MKITKIRVGAATPQQKKTEFPLHFSTSFRAPACTRLRTWSAFPPVRLFPVCYSRKSPANMVLNVLIFAKTAKRREWKKVAAAAIKAGKIGSVKKSRPFFSSLLQKCSLFETCKQQSTFFFIASQNWNACFLKSCRGLFPQVLNYACVLVSDSINFIVFSERNFLHCYICRALNEALRFLRRLYLNKAHFSQCLTWNAYLCVWKWKTAYIF
jgi:hypothetical protein